MSGGSALRSTVEFPSPSPFLSAPIILEEIEAPKEEPLGEDEILEIEVPSTEEIAEDEEDIDEEPIELSEEADAPRQGDRSETEDQSYFTHQKVQLDERVSPDKDLESHYHLGVAYMEMDLIDEAIPEFEEALNYGPKRVDCLVMLAQCHMKKGGLDRSISYLEKASEMKGLTKEECTRINRELGRVYEASGQKEKACQIFKRAGLKATDIESLPKSDR
jgi:tetratricopeptide (TPR) repeat protein